MASSTFLLVPGLRGIALWFALVGATLWISAPAPQPEATSGLKFADVAREAGIGAKTIYGGERKNKYQLENTGCGAAFFDYDNDGRLDVFLVNGTRLEGFTASEAPTNHLYRNNGNGAFTDVTAKAKLTRMGWGQGVCVGDYDNDGYEDLFVTYWGDNVLYRNNGDGTFTDVTRKSGLFGGKRRWGSGRSEEHTSELQSLRHLVCRLLLEKKKQKE